ncbi:MAG TPA: GDSL-type esterase/lipase family protein [Desulfotignum sp.]|nr:GDSL-type esterase/lipase family protein [Desulfotignum sp.]
MKIICHGDSLTQGSDMAKPDTWTSLLGNHLRVPVVNTGISGDTTAGMLARFSVDVVPQKPDIAILMGGTNDLWYDLDVNLILANLSAMVNQAVFYDIAPVIGLPLPICVEQVNRMDWAPPAKGYAYLSGRIRELVNRLAVEARAWEAPVLDFYHLFLDDQAMEKIPWFLADGVHPAKSGHQAMADLGARVFKNL